MKKRKEIINLPTPESCSSKTEAYRCGYNKALEDFEQRIGKCKTAWKIKEYNSYVKTDWLIKWLKKLKKKENK